MNIEQTGNVSPVFNLADFEARDTAWLEVQNKKGDGPLLFNGEKVRVEVRSPGTREAMVAKHNLEQAAQARMFAGMRGKQVKETVDSKLQEKADRLSAVTVRFDNFPVAPAALFSNPQMAWFTDQVEAFHNDWANF